MNRNEAPAASLKVVVITHGFYPRIGGAERLVASVSPLLQERGIDVHILTRRLPGTLPFEVFSGVPVHRLPVPGPKPLAALAFSLAALPLIVRLKPDLIHAHELISPATTAILAKNLLGMMFHRCPVVATVHRSGPPGDVMRMKSRPFGRLRLRALIRSIDRFVVISREIDAELAGEGVPAGKRLTIPNGVDIRQFTPLEEEAARRSLRVRLGLPPSARLAVFAGRLAPEKRISHLLEIWPSIRSVFPDACLLVLGTGPEEMRLKALALQRMPGDAIRWLGAQDQVAPYYQAADLFVLPSVAEGLSVALLEAMACGLPPVVTAVGGAPEVVAHGESGWLLPPDDPQALRAAILALFENHALRSAMGCQARRRIVETYSLDRIADQLCSLYHTVLLFRAIGRKGGRA
jgi:glycosyltransferase involved in cell wall biosynthesis